MRSYSVIVWMVGATLAGCARQPELGVEQLSDELMAVRERNRLLKEEIAICGVEPASPKLLAELKQVLGPVGGEVSQRGHATVITLDSSLVFVDPFSLRLRDDADARLDLLATALLLHPELDIGIVGHTGNQPIPKAYRRAFETRRQQSLAMADRFASHLEMHYEIASRRFVVAGRGTQSPVAPSGADAPDPNYRIEVMLYRTGEPPPAPR